MSTITDDQAQAIASSWLAKLTGAAAANDANAFAATFLPHGWLRDVVTFTWDCRALRGREAIAHYLSTSNSLENAALTNVALATEPYYRPHVSPHDANTIEAGFTYETRIAVGRAYVHLRQDEQGQWLALTVGMIVQDLKGHEETPCVDDSWAEGYRTWTRYAREQRENIENQPYVLIGESPLPVRRKSHADRM